MSKTNSGKSVITIKTTTVAKLNTGDIPDRFIKDLLTQGGDGYALGQTPAGWGIGDLTSDYSTTLDEVTVE